MFDTNIFRNQNVNTTSIPHTSRRHFLFFVTLHSLIHEVICALLLALFLCASVPFPMQKVSQTRQPLSLLPLRLSAYVISNVKLDTQKSLCICHLQRKNWIKWTKFTFFASRRNASHCFHYLGFHSIELNYTCIQFDHLFPPHLCSYRCCCS